MTRAGNPRLVGYAALAALGLLGALALRRPELAIVAAPFALLLAIGTRARDPGVEVVFAMAAERTLEGAEVEAALILRARRAVDRVEVLLELPRSVEVVDGHFGACGSTASRRRARARAHPPLHAVGLVQARKCPGSSARRVSPGDVGGTRGRIASPQGVPTPGRAAPPPGADGDAGTRRQSGRAGEGRRSRVRGHPGLRAGRPGSIDQLAGVCPSSGARRQRTPSREEHGRRALHRQLRRRPRRRPERPRGGGTRRRRRWRRDTSSIATGSASSASAACCVGYSRGWA